MSRETYWSVILLFAGGLGLAVAQWARLGEIGTIYVKTTEQRVELPAPEPGQIRIMRWKTAGRVDPIDRGQPNVELSVARTIGLWCSALLTLAVFSFLAGDNPAYKLAESIFVGTSAGYVMVAAFWDELVPNLFGNLMPELTRRWGLAHLGVEVDQLPDPNWLYLVPLVMSGMMLWQLSPRGGWIARWPLAFFIGATAGVRLYTYFEADFLHQISQTIMPLIVLVYDDAQRRSLDVSATISHSLANITIIVGVVSSLTYFYFSAEHKGVVGGITRVGILVLMITFGGTFAYTVMGRIALLIERFEFLFIEWLWLIDPLGIH